MRQRTGSTEPACREIVAVRLGNDLSISHARNLIAEPHERLRLRPRCQVAGEVGRKQPAQRPTIAQDGAFLNYPARGYRRWLATRTSRAYILPNRLTPLGVSVKR